MPTFSAVDPNYKKGKIKPFKPIPRPPRPHYLNPWIKIRDNQMWRRKITTKQRK